MKLIEKIESCNFECEAGPLALSEDWATLRKIVDLWMVVIERGGKTAPILHTSGKGGWRFVVYTNKGEAQSMADKFNRENYGGNQICDVRHFIECGIELGSGK